MTKEIANLKPKSLWKNFADLNAVPRPSKKEERVIAFMKEFGENLGLETKIDEVGNVLIIKPATSGMEDCKKVALQSHLDMVHQKNSDTDFDFDTEGIKMYIDGDWVKAKGTTLGADNGIGVATMMAILESKDIPHPALECLFTIDEETGMTGAFGLKPGFLTADILLNLDTEDDDELTIGCAGGVNVNATGSYQEEESSIPEVSLQIELSGLNGGHSGMDIHKGYGNANKLNNRLLSAAMEVSDIRIVEIDGGGLRNAIPRESKAIFYCGAPDKDQIIKKIEAEFESIKAEYKLTDPKIKLTWNLIERSGPAASVDFSKQFITAIYGVLNGIYRMSPSLENTVQSSNNLAQVKVKDGEFSCLCLTRSSVETEKAEVVKSLEAAFSIVNAKVETDGDYPGWTPATDSAILNLMEELYREKFNAEPRVMAGHGGLECGIIGSNYPDLDMVSFGPNIRGPHSPDEKVQISSVQKFWDYLLDALTRIPKK
jgi:dipeptidase D